MPLTDATERDPIRRQRPMPGARPGMADGTVSERPPIEGPRAEVPRRIRGSGVAVDAHVAKV